MSRAGMILVVGGTGLLGQPVTRQLIGDGFPVRVLTSAPKRARAIFGDHPEYAQGEVSDIASLMRALDGCEAVYINLKGGPTKQDFIRVEEIGSKNIYRTAQSAGVKKIIQIGGANFHARNASHISARVKAEAEAALIASGLTYVILRPSWFYESLPLFVQGKKVIYVGSGGTMFHFLAATDYATIVSRCFQSGVADNKVLTIFGPEALPIPEALRRFLGICYPQVTIQTLPIWLAKLSSAVMFNKGLKAAVDLMAFFDRHDDRDAAPSPDEADRLFGRCSTTLEEWSEYFRSSSSHR